MKQRAKRLCSLLMVLCLLIGLVPFGAFATETSDSGVEILYQQLILGDDLTMKFEIAIEESVAEMADVKLTVGGAETVYTVSELTPNENGNYLVSVDVAAAQMTDDITVAVNVGEFEIASKNYTILAYAEQILDGNYGNATKALVKEMLNYGAKAQTYFDYKAGSLAEYDGAVTPATMPTEAEAISVEGSVNGISFYGSSMLFTGKLAIRYYFTAPNGVGGYTFTANGNTYTAAEKNGMYYVDVAGINPQDIDEPVVLTVSDESSSLSVGYGPMNYITRMYNGNGSDNLKNLLQALYGYHLAAEAFVESGETQDKIEELAIPEGARMIADFSTTVTPHIPTNWGTPELAAYNSYDVYNGRAGVFGMGATGEGYMWYNNFGLNGIDLSTVETITFRMMVKSGTRALWIKHDETEGIDIINQISAFDQWIEYTCNVTDLGITDLSNATIQLRFATTIGAGQSEWVWLDQVYVTEKTVEELAIPEGATMISDFSTTVTPYISETWGSGAAGAYYNSYDVYNGRAGVFAMGATGESFVWYDSFGLNGIDLSNAETITFRMKVKSGLRALWIKHDEIDEGIDIIDQISAFDEWIEYTCKVADLGITDLSNATIQLRIATWDNGNCEYVWLDQVYVVNKVDVVDPEQSAIIPSYEQNRNTKQLDVLAFWMPPIEDQHYQWMKEAGITALVIDNQYDAYEGAPLRNALSLCDKYGIDAYITVNRQSASATYASNYAMYQDHPSFKGFYVDEPTTEEEINNIAAMTISAEAMGLQVIANKMPWTDADYTEWFNTAFANCGDNLIVCATNYPLLTDGVRSDWLEINGLTNEAAATYGAPHWQFVATTGYGDRRQVTEADIRWQYYAALAYGAKGIGDFSYCTPSYGGEFNDPQHAPIWWTDSSDTSTYYRSDTYYALQAVNQEISKFDHVLLSYDWQGVMTKTTTLGSLSDTGEALRNAPGVLSSHDRISSLSSTENLLVGVFKDSNNYDGFLVVNFDETLNNTAANTVSITFNNASTALAYVKGERQIVTLTNGVYTCELLPGEAVFVIPVAGDSEAQPSEIAIPEGAVLVEDFADCSNYDGVAGVKALTTGTYTNILPADFDYSSYSHITFRMKLADGASVTVGGKSISAVAGDWVDVSVKLSELTGTEAVVSGNVWINQVYAQYIPEELAIPEGATLVSDFSYAASPWNNPNWGSHDVGITNWYEQYDGVAGVQALGMSADGYTMWTAMLPEDFDYSDYTHLNIRLKANKDALRAIYMFDGNMNNVNIIESVTANNQWITVKVKLEDIPGVLFGLANVAGTTGEMLWVDQVYVTTEEAAEEVEELAIPEDATLISYCDTTFTPWINPNWGTHDLESQWYEQFQGRAGVLGVGSPSTGNAWNHFSTPGSVSEADAEGKTLVIRYYATKAPLTFAVYGCGSAADVIVDVDVSEFKVNEWAELRVDLTEFFEGQSADQMFEEVHIRLGSSSAGEFFYIDQMYIDVIEPAVEELPIPEQATLFTDYSKSWTPWVNSNWGSHDLTYQWYEEYEGRAGVMGYGSNVSGNSWNWFTLGKPMNFTDASDKFVVLRLYATNPVLTMALYASGTNKEVSVTVADIPTNQWYDLRVDISDMVGDGMGTELHMKLGTSVSGQTLFIDSIYFIEEVELPEGATLISNLGESFTPWVNGNWGTHDLESQWYPEFQGHSGVLGVGSPSTGNAWNHFNTPGAVSEADAEGKTLVIRYYATKAPLTFAVYGCGSMADVIVDVPVSEFKVNEWAEIRIDLTKFFEGQSADQLFEEIHIRLGSSSAGEFFYIDQMFIEIDESVVWQAGSFGGENVTHSVNTIGSEFENRIAVENDAAKLYIRDAALDSYSVGDRVKVAFKLYSGVEVGAYSALTVADEHKNFDGQFIGGQWYNVNYFATVESDSTGKYVELGINNASGETVYLSGLTFSSDALPEELFGGVTVEMLTHTNVDNAQMQGFLMTDGEYVLALDSGYPTDDDHLYEQLLLMAPDAHVDGWFISHGHDDHYGALLELLKDDKVTIGTLYFHFPNATDRNGNTEGLALQNEFEAMVQTRVAEGKIGNVVTIGKGGVYTYGDMTIKTLNDAYFGSANFLNDSTVVMKLETPGENLLFLGDLGDRGDVYLEDADFLAEIQDCSVVQMAHHGQNGTTQKFYNACTGMKMALYCAPDWLWNNDNGGGVNSGSWQTLTVRQWLRDMGVGVSYYLDGTDLILE